MNVIGHMRCSVELIWEGKPVARWYIETTHGLDGDMWDVEYIYDTLEDRL
jgi:hypothetical protein